MYLLGLSSGGEEAGSNDGERQVDAASPSSTRLTSEMRARVVTELERGGGASIEEHLRTRIVRVGGEPGSELGAPPPARSCLPTFRSSDSLGADTLAGKVRDSGSCSASVSGSGSGSVSAPVETLDEALNRTCGSVVERVQVSGERRWRCGTGFGLGGASSPENRCALT